MDVKINPLVKFRKESYGGVLIAPFCSEIFLNNREYSVFSKYTSGEEKTLGRTVTEKRLFEMEILVEVK